MKVDEVQEVTFDKIQYRKIEKNIPISNKPNARYLEIAKQMEINDSILFKTNTEEIGRAHV